jgi:spore germination cell wall hydrolase CwlJ-like protein
MEKFVRTSVLASFFVLFTIGLYSLTQYKFTELNSISENELIVTLKERERQLDCLAINVYREAGNQPFEGKVGVAQVTMNRVVHPDFPDDVCLVVFQRNKTMEKVVCQFSWYCDRTHRNRAINQKAYEESYQVAKKVLLENFKLDSLNEALYFHADYVNPQWRHLQRVTKIGQHIFYKPRENKGRV